MAVIDETIVYKPSGERNELNVALPIRLNAVKVYP